MCMAYTLYYYVNSHSVYDILNAIYTLLASGTDPWPSVQLRVSFTGEVDIDKNNTHIATVISLDL